MGRFGGGERAGGVLGFSLQVLIFCLVLLVSQFRGVMRRLRLSLVHPRPWNPSRISWPFAVVGSGTFATEDEQMTACGRGAAWSAG